MSNGGDRQALAFGDNGSASSARGKMLRCSFALREHRNMTQRELGPASFGPTW